MGAYLSEPLTDKSSTDESNDKLSFGVSSMQGWRVSQEDSHNSILNFDTNSSLFAVYDGHGGAEVAKYCEMKMPHFIRDTTAYKEGRYPEALEEAFLNIDASITSSEVIEVLKSLSDNTESSVDHDETVDDKEEVSDLWEEASMPLDKIMAKYQEAQGNPLLAKLKKEAEKPLSPYLRSKRSGSSGESSGAGCSSKGAYSDECEVSSSIKDNEDEAKPSESQVTTTNGESKSDGDKVNEKCTEDSSKAASSQISGSGDSVAPDTSDDSKAAGSSSESKEDEKVNGDVTESKEDATSSSQENGEVKSPSKKGKALVKTSASSSDTQTPEESAKPKRNRRAAANLYNSILGLIQSQDDDDDSDSNDETFQGKEDTSTDDDEDEAEAVNGVDGESSEEDVEEEDTTDEDDIDDEMDAFNMAIKNEPGSNSGCTAVVAFLKGNQLYVANAGDSRCVVCRDGKAVDMSIDHKPEDEIEFERITKAGGKVSSDGRVNGGLNLSRAIGDHGYKQNQDLNAKEQMITALPDIKTLTVDLTTDEFMVLACDGIWNSMTSQEVVDFVKCRLDKEKLSEICEEMFDRCLSPNTAGDGTGCDNMTAVIVKFKSSNVSKKRTKEDEEEETSQAKRTKTEDSSTSVTSSE